MPVDRARWRIRAVALLLATLVVGRLLVVGAAPAAAATPSCPPNTNSTAVSSTSSCVAEAMRRVRSYLLAGCVVAPKTAARTNPLYSPTECRRGSGVQAEAIAQARFIAYLNATGSYRDPPAANGISANVQWEVGYSKASSQQNPPMGGRVDVLDYDRTNASGPINIAELKQDGSGEEDRAGGQVVRYQSDLPKGSAGRQVVPKNVLGYSDVFRVLVVDCDAAGLVPNRVVYQYDVKASARYDGVLMVGHSEKAERCPGAGQPPLDPVKPEEPAQSVPDVHDPPYDPPVTVPAPGRDADHDGVDDFWEQFQKDHPELGPIDAPPLPASPVPDGKTVVLGAAGALVILAAIAVCVVGCAELLALLAAAETGEAAATFAASPLLLLLAGLVGWNLWGDPHIVTLDRLKYDLQSVGEFHLLELPDAGIDVQGRFRASGPNVSVLDRVATEINDHRVEVAGSSVKVDGVDLSLADGGVYLLGGGALIARDGDSYAVVWPGHLGQPLAMVARGGSIGFVVPPERLTGSRRGLLGNGDGDPQNDLALRDGTPLPVNASPSTLHGTFADSWRISDDESFFTYGQNESTATFTDRSAPQNVVTTGDFSDAEVAAATATCSQAGVETGPQFDACVLDVLVTDASYAASAALVDDVIVSADGLDFDSGGRINVDFEGSVPPNFVASRYSADSATSRIAGPIFDAGGYRFYVRNVGRHDGMSLDTDVYAFGPVVTDDQPQSVDVSVNKRQLGSILFDGGAPRLSDGMAGTLTPTGNGTTAAGKSFAKFRLHVPLGPLGESVDAEFTPHNFDGLLNTSLGFDNLALNLAVPPAQHFAAAEPLTTPGGAGSGMASSDGAGVLESPGAADEYELTVAAGGAGKAHVISPRTCRTPLTVVLTSKTTGARVGRWSNTCARITTPDLPGDTYLLTVTPYASAASATYALDMFVRPDPQQFAYPLGSVVRNGVPAAGAGNLETVASQDVYTFTAPGGDLYLDFRGCAPGLTWQLRSHGTAGAVILGYCFDSPLAGVAAGDYDLTVSTDATQAGTYAFQLFSTPVAPQDFPVQLPLTVDDQRPAAGAGNLETKQSVDRYAFTVAAPAPLYIDTQSCLDPNTLAWRLVRVSDGTTVDSGTCVDRQTATLPVGDYRLDVSSSGEGVGPYQLQAWTVPMPAQTFTLAVPATVSPDRPGPGAGNLETKASQDVYSFSLPDGKTAVYVDQVNCATPNLLTWKLINDVNGVAVTVANGTCQDRQVRQVARGNYRLVVSPIGENHGTYSLRVVPSDTATPTILHVPQTTAYNGQAIPIDATTSCLDPSKCFAQATYRTTARTDPAGAAGLPAGSWITQNLSATGTTTVSGQTLTTWKGAIPAAAVTTTGVDYYLSAGDGDNRNELPTAPAAPGGLGGAATSLGAGVVDLAYLHVATVSPPLLAHITPVYAQAGTPVALDLKASCSTGSCTARLHYRTSTGVAPGTTELLADPGWPIITMTQTATASLGDAAQLLTYTATIPATKVDTRGVDYYFDVTDTHTTSYWPGTTYQGYFAPRDGMRTAYHTLHVLEAPHVVHVPVMTAPYRTATPITATANCPSTRTCTARLYYRTTTNNIDALLTNGAPTAQQFTDVPMNLTRVAGLTGNDVITVGATIPASFADTRGIDYLFRIDDGSTTTWFPGTGQVPGYANVDGTRVAYQHIRVLEAPHITPTPVLTTKALEPYTVTSRMTCATEACSMTLHWRNDLAPGELDTGWHDIPMTKTGSPVATPLGNQQTYVSTIPGNKVTTRGLAYYLEGYDGYVHDYSPGTSYWGAYLPLDGQHFDGSGVVSINGNQVVIGSFFVRVLEPPHLVHAPPGLVERGQPLTLTATSNCSSISCPATLAWTDKDGHTQTVTMSAVRKVDGSTNPALPGDIWQYTATIPGADTTSTVHYNLAVSDGCTTDSTLPLQALAYDKLPAP